MLRRFTKTRQEGADQQRKDPVLSYPVSIPEYEFLFEPRFAPDGRHVLFLVGDRASVYGTFTLHILDIQTRKLTEVKTPHQSVGRRFIAWSPDSRYLAYIRGALPIPFGGYKPAELHVYDVQTGKDHFIVQNPGVVNSIGWTPENRLLYSLFPPPQQGSRGEPGSEKSSNEDGYPYAPPAVYEMSLARGQKKLILRDGYRPAPSPDGKWIAFFGSSAPDKAQPKNPLSPFSAAGKYLLLLSRSGNKVRLVRRETSTRFSELLWAPDSSRLLIISRYRRKEGAVEARIVAYDVAREKERRVAAIAYKDRTESDNYEDDPLFRPLVLSNDGTTLFFSLAQSSIDDPGNHGLFLKAVTLADGKLSTLCRLGGINLDWHDASAKPGVNAEAPPF